MSIRLCLLSFLLTDHISHSWHLHKHITVENRKEELYLLSFIYGVRDLYPILPYLLYFIISIATIAI